MKTVNFPKCLAGMFTIGTTMTFLLAMSFLFPVRTAHASTCTSQATGNWSAAATWMGCGGLVPQNGDTVFIASPNTVTVDVATASLSSFTVNSGGQLNISTNNVTATTITVSGTISSSGTATITGALTFSGSGTYVHAQNGGTIPAATWNAGSTVQVTGVTNTVPSGLTQQFANFTWNSAQTGRIDLAGALTNITGNFTVLSTSSGNTCSVNFNSLVLVDSGSPTIKIGGNFIASGAYTSVNLNRGTGTVVVNLGGSFNFTGAYFASQNAGAATPTTFNFTGSNQTFNEAATGGWLNFACGSAQVASDVNFVVTNGVSLTMNGNLPLSGTNTNSLTVQSGGTINMGTNFITGTGPFTLSAGGTLDIGDPNGITSSGATGNIQTTGTRTFNTGANYTYNGTAAQVTGNGLPATVNDLTINNAAGVTLSASVTVTTALAVTSGVFNQGSTNNLTAGAISVNPGATFTNVGTGSITLNGGLVNNGTVIIDGNGVVCPGGTPSSPISVTSAASQTWTGSGVFKVVNVTLSNQMTSLGIADFGGSCVQTNGCSNFQFLSCSSAPTAVTLKTFTATDYDGKVLLQWRTGYEVNNIGFHLYREEGDNLYLLTPGVVAGSALVAGPGIGLTVGRSYTWVDDSLPDSQSKARRYWLEDMDLNGKRNLYGPIVPVYAVGQVPQTERSMLLSRISTVQAARTVSSSANQKRTRLKLSEFVVPMQPFYVRDSADPQTVQWDLAATSAVKFLIQEEGWYRVSQPELVAYGLGTIDPGNLRLFVTGREVPMVVSEQSEGRFGPADSIEFYGTGLDTPSTDIQTYWLVVGSGAGKRVPQIRGGSLAQESPSFPFRVEARPRVVYAPALPVNREGDRFFGPLVSTDPNNPTTVQLAVNHPDTAAQGKAVLEVYLQGVTAGQHTVTVILNGNAVGQMAFDGQNVGSISLKLTQSGLLQQGENQVALVAQGGETDMSVMDSIFLTYWHTYTADNDSLRCTANGGGLLSIGGFSSPQIRAFDITDPTSPVEVAGNVMLQGPPYSITIGIPGKGTRSLLALADAQVAHPAAITPNSPSTWHSSTNKADMVIISHGDFIGTIEPLKRFRESQGMSVALIDVQDLYDEFSFGNKTPEALRDFLQSAVSSWQRTPRFVLLVGDASVDPRNYLGYGDFDFVPTKLIETANNETVSDDWFVDFEGNGLPELPIGRITVRAAGDAATVAAKIINYEQQPRGATWPRKALFVADIPGTFNFETSSTQVAALLPGDIAVEEIFRSKFASEALANQQLLNGIDNGVLLVNYMGHGSEDSWGDELFSTDDIGSLTNGLMLPFFVNMTCWNGWFANPYDETLAEALLKAGQGGAIAVWASSGLAAPDGQLAMDKKLMSLLFNGTPLTLGEATARAKAATSDMDVRRTWILFGDPATRLK